MDATQALTPLYSTANPSDPIVVYEGPATASLSEPATGAARISLEWFPTPRFVVQFELDQPYKWNPGPTDFKLTDPSLVAQVGFRSERISWVREPHVLMRGILESAAWDQGTHLQAVVFHLVNFPSYEGEFITTTREDGTVITWMGRLEFATARWRVTLDSVPNHGELAEGLKEQGGYAITHVGRLERADGASFTPEAAEQALDDLRLALSFGRGAWVYLALPVGIGLGQETSPPTWERWTIWTVEPWRAMLSWFPFGRRDQAAEAARIVFAAISDADEDPRKILELAISWFIDANSRPVAQPGIVVAQIGLELLAWATLVQGKSALSPDGFGQLAAHDQLRLLLTVEGIPTGIPPGLSGLMSYSKGNANIDGPQAFTQIRNRVVHPPRKGALTGPDPSLFDADLLGLWYLELSILSICGYRGPYLSRVQSSQKAIAVPWGQSDGTLAD